MSPRWLLPCLLLLLFLGCSKTPSDSFLTQAKSTLAAGKVPALVVHLHRSLEAGGPAAAVRTKAAAEILGNQMGFRIELSTEPRHGWAPEHTRYEFTGFQAPNLSGLTFDQSGDTVRIRPSYAEQPIIEWARTPEAGYKSLFVSPVDSKENRELGLAAMGVKDSRQVLEKLSHASAESRQAKAKTFSDNVARAVQDNGFARAWLLQYRKREATVLPAGSPFWTLLEALLGGSAPPVVEPDVAFRACQSFFARRGQPDTKASLRTYAVIAFQDRNGNCVKTEPWTTFVGE